MVYALTTHGKHLGSYKLQGVKNRDWEDIALGPGPQEGQHYLYIGEIGDNRARYDRKYIYRVSEPRVTVSQRPGEFVLSDVETITIRYPDGGRDAETLLIDPLTKDLYIISKREAQVGVYQAPYPQSTTDLITLDLVTTLSLNETATNGAWLVGGDISPAGTAILLKSYIGVYHWTRTAQQSVSEALAAKPLPLPYFQSHRVKLYVGRLMGVATIPSAKRETVLPPTCTSTRVCRQVASKSKQMCVFVGAGPRACPPPGQPQGVAPTSALENVLIFCGLI